VDFADELPHGEVRIVSVELLSALLLVVMEILHTIGMSIRERALVPEPFLIVGLIASIRRILVLTAEQGFPSAEKRQRFAWPRSS